MHECAHGKIQGWEECHRCEREACGCGALDSCRSTWDKAKALGSLGRHRPKRMGGCTGAADESSDKEGA